MTDPTENPVDLSPLREEMGRRASRMAGQVMRRVSVARDRSNRRGELTQAVLLRMARWALPATLAAAAGLAAVLATEVPSDRREPMAALVMSAGPAVRWIAGGAPPSLGEVVAVSRMTP